MKDEYVIISKTAIQKRIEETIKYANEAYKEDVNDEATQRSCNATIQTLEGILSQSTSLIPEIEKAFDAGQEFGTNMALFYNTDKVSRVEFESTFDKEEYITNLKLDI